MQSNGHIYWVIAQEKRKLYTKTNKRQPEQQRRNQIKI